MAEKNLSKNFYDEMKRLEPRYPTKQALLLPALHFAQDEFGWLSESTLDEIAEHLELHPAQVRETASFYTMFNLKPIGRNLIRVCTNVACCLRGGEEILAKLEKKLGVEVGETTADGKITLFEEECLGACGAAPAMMVNNNYFEKITIFDLDGVLERLE
ncbi:MAG: hypothetical protein A3K03_00495 [Bdellovibrionales bacterium RIFOXYD1_FULL_44_7]|nr:MAG: hypothetical protein A3K03_00495 [Bdellovibrionales bacterium RIFOXYD1_FULL_44_7]